MKKYFILLGMFLGASLSSAQIVPVVRTGAEIMAAETRAAEEGARVAKAIETGLMQSVNEGMRQAESLERGIQNSQVDISTSQTIVSQTISQSERITSQLDALEKSNQARQAALQSQAASWELRKRCLKAGLPPLKIGSMTDAELEAYLAGLDTPVSAEPDVVAAEPTPTPAPAREPEPAPAREERYISPFAAFREPDYTSYSRTEEPERWQINAATRASSSGRSLQSVEAECRANGMPQEQIDIIPPTERLARLEEWLSTYYSMKKGWTGPSRYEDVVREGKLSATNVEGDQIAWIREQEDFKAIKDNYLKDSFDGPFHPQVTSMRILAVNDITKEIDPLKDAAREISHNGLSVTVDVMPTIDSAKGALEHAVADGRAYDIVLLDYHGLQGQASDLSTWIHRNNKVSVPVIFYSSAGSTPEVLFNFYVTGRISVAATTEEAHQVLNYASNIVATGKAYPDR